MTFKIKTPTNLVLFGITGDLANKKIIPALFNLYKADLLPQLFTVIGFARRDLSETDVNNLVKESLSKYLVEDEDQKRLDEFLNLFKYHQGNFTKQGDFEKLGKELGLIDKKWETCSNKLFYLSVPPNFYETILKNLAETGLTEECSDETGWTRVIVEKPFGKDFDTAQELETLLENLFKEEQIYRIDHFIAKEMLQNIVAFRFANNFLESSWNRDFIDSIEIYFSENFGVENRINFYDGIGALRDVGQNHLLQILALTTMEDPGEFSNKNIRQERALVLEQLIPPTLNQIKDTTTRAQYEGYKEIETTKPDSKTETYFKITAFLNSKKWEGVPITLESGKYLSENDLKIYVNFKEKNGFRNRVIFDLAGDDMGIYIDFWAKRPGLEMEIEKRTLSFSLLEDCEACNIAEPYEKLILDCMSGDQTLFVSSREVKALWKFIDPIICAWDKDEVPLLKYKKGAKEVK